MMQGYGHPGYGEYYTTGQSGFGGYGGFGAIGLVTSDARTIYNQMASGDNAGATAALTALSASQGAAYAASVCQQMEYYAMTADAQAAAASGDPVDQQSQNAVVAVCQAASIQAAAMLPQSIALYQQLQQGSAGQAAVVAALKGMDAATRTTTCNQMGQIAAGADTDAATSTGQVAFTNQNAVIAACTAAGVSMPAPGGVPTPTPVTPAPVTAGMSTTSILLLGVVGAGILYFLFSGGSKAAAAAV